MSDSVPMKLPRSALRRPILLCGIALVTLAAIAVYAAYRADLDEARARLAGRSEFVTTPCGPIEYAVAGTSNA